MKPLFRRMTLALTVSCLPLWVLAEGINSFTRITNAAISGHNREYLVRVTPQDCAEACVSSARTTWCKSFDYYKANHACDLSDKRARDVGGLKTDYPGNPFDHYVRTADPLIPFAHTANAAISGHNTEHLSQVSPEDCAIACSDGNRAHWCKSFDYRKPSRTCDLSDKRASDVGGLKTNYDGNPYDHYSLVAREGVANPIPGNRFVLFIGIDGLRGDALFCAGCARTPALSALATSGAYHLNVLAGGPQVTLSGPGWGTAFTGFWASDHGVTGNGTSLRMRKPHVFDLIKQAHPTATVGVVGNWYNITHNLKPVGADYVYTTQSTKSQQATDVVKYWLSWKNPPTAIFYYLDNVDIHAPSYAPLNAYYQSKISYEDAQIEQVLKVLAARPTYASEDWLIVVTSDHGGINSTHGGQSAGERSTPLILTNMYQNSTKRSFCRGNLSTLDMRQIDGAAPHILEFLDLPNTTAGRTHPFCGRK